MNSFCGAAEALEIPPGDSILCADDGGIGPEHVLQLRGKLGQAVSFHRQEDDVG
jgi:hypothetical protein